MSSITMYRLMLYYLLFLVAVAAVLSFFKLLPYNGVDILLGAFYLVSVCKLVNYLFAKVLKVKTNTESALITGFILSLIFGPAPFLSNIIPLTVVGTLAMASKYLIVWRGRHIFNPAAFGAVASAALFGNGASWWLAGYAVAPFIILGGLLILKKIRRFEMAGVFLLFYIISNPQNILSIPSSPILFFSLVMLVEPLTSPFKKSHQIIYAVLLIVLFYLLGNVIPYPLEVSLLIGNIFAFIVNKSFRQVLILKKKEKLTKDVTGFWFEPFKKFDFKPVQFLEWTLSHPNPDNRGIRRFFTIASSPTEDLILLASKFYEKPSTFKQALLKMEVGDEIIASDLEGEFSIPDKLDTKLVFIAGGIGVTPFRSMAKYMVDQKESRDIVLLFSNKTKEDIVFKDILEKADKFDLKTVYVNTDKDGYIDDKLIKEKVSDWKERIFYISGPEPMVEAFEKMLSKMGIAKKNVRRDYFPGYTDTHRPMSS